MKKVMLGLVMVVMLMSLVGCGTKDSTEEKNPIVESEVETEVKEDIKIDGISGEVIQDTEEVVKQETFYGKIKITGETTCHIQYTFGNGGSASIPYEGDLTDFETGDCVKFVLETSSSNPIGTIVSFEKYEP